MIEERLKKISGFLQQGEALLINDNNNRFYFSGFNSSAGVVLITKDEQYLLVDFRYFERAKNNVSALNVRLLEKYYANINELLLFHNIKTLFIETDKLTFLQVQRLKENIACEVSTDSCKSEKITELRSIKDKFEIDSIKKAQGITDAAYSYILNRINENVTEREIALDLEFFMRKNGSEGVAFDTIVVSGKNSSSPHGVPTDKKIQKGDFITMDFGARVNGYCSDMTRTVALGNVTAHQREVYEIVLKAQTETMNYIKAGVTCKSADKIARDIICDAGYGECFGHGLGHSLGLEIHENPACNTRDDTLLQSGMIMTVEPGIYIEGEFGVRIENMVLVDEHHCLNLTKSVNGLTIL